MRRAAFTAAAIVVAAVASPTGNAAAQERWATGFRQGFSFATLNHARGPMLQLSCDTSGLKPGRGAVILELRAPKGSIAPAATTTEIVVAAAGQNIRMKAHVSVATARDTVPGSARRRNGETLVETRASPTEDAITLAYDLDGSEAKAQPLAQLAIAIAREPREIVARAPALNLESKFPSRQAAPAMRGFDKGCQDALPAPDDELQWDWQQGLDRVDDKLQVTLAAAADDAGPNAPKLILRCIAGALDARIINRPDASGDARMAATIEIGPGERAQSIWTGTASGRDWTIAGDDAARFIAALWRGARLSIAPAGAGNAQALHFPIAGTPLATRKLIEACPTPALPPKG